jgi:hypothetical protein
VSDISELAEGWSSLWHHHGSSNLNSFLSVSIGLWNGVVDIPH